MAKKFIYIVKVEKAGRQKLFRFQSDDERQFFLNQLRKRDSDAKLELAITPLDLVDPPSDEDKKKLGQRLVDIAEKLRIYAADKELMEMLETAEDIANGTI